MTRKTYDIELGNAISDTRFPMRGDDMIPYEKSMSKAYISMLVVGIAISAVCIWTLILWGRWIVSHSD